MSLNDRFKALGITNEIVVLDFPKKQESSVFAEEWKYLFSIRNGDDVSFGNSKVGVIVYNSKHEFEFSINQDVEKEQLRSFKSEIVKSSLGKTLDFIINNTEIKGDVRFTRTNNKVNYVLVDIVK